jgi:hypothetical protein
VATEKSDNKVLVFYSYSHRDERYRNRLGVSMALLRREGAIEEWFDRRITAGDQWADEIAQQMDAAQLILLLISPDFIASDYCYGKELTQAIERNNKGKAWVIPIIVRPCEFSGTPFAKLQALPTDAKPVTIWGNSDKAWLNVQQGIAKAVKEIAAGVNSTIASGGTSIVRSADDVPPKPPRKAKGKTKAPAKVKLVKRAKAAHTATVATVKKMGERAAARPGGEPNRIICDAQGKTFLPGKVARREGKPAKGDPAIDETYEWLGTTYHFFWDVFKRNSWDGKGADLKATVHYDKNFSNAFWDGKQMIIGDGDKKLFKRFTSLDMIAKQFSNGVVQADTKLTYWEQAGTLMNSMALVFAVLVKQYALQQTVAQADWLVGDGIFPSGVNGRALMSFAAPGTAYDDKVLGKDPQPGHMSGFVRTSDDNGGIHTNSGIPNHAFYQIATALGGFAWEKAGRIWYDAMRDKQLKADARFSDFARITLQHAKKLFGPRSVEAAAVKEGWGKVGVKIGR